MVDNESDLETHTTSKTLMIVAKSYKSLAVVTKNSI